MEGIDKRKEEEKNIQENNLNNSNIITRKKDKKRY